MRNVVIRFAGTEAEVMPEGTQKPGGTTGRVTWPGLVNGVFRRSGVIRPGEQVVAIELDDGGISFVVERV